MLRIACGNDHTCATQIIIQIRWNLIIDRINIVKRFIIIDWIVSIDGFLEHLIEKSNPLNLFRFVLCNSTYKILGQILGKTKLRIQFATKLLLCANWEILLFLLWSWERPINKPKFVFCTKCHYDSTIPWTIVVPCQQGCNKNSWRTIWVMNYRNFYPWLWLNWEKGVWKPWWKT